MDIELTFAQVCMIWALVDRAQEEYEGRGRSQRVELLSAIKAELQAAFAKG